jgi:hypothetical protein
LTIIIFFKVKMVKLLSKLHILLNFSLINIFDLDIDVLVGLHFAIQKSLKLILMFMIVTILLTLKTTFFIFFVCKGCKIPQEQVKYFFSMPKTLIFLNKAYMSY